MSLLRILRRRPRPPVAELVIPAEAPPAPPPTASEDHARLLQTCELLEADLDSAVAEVKQSGDAALLRGARMQDEAAAIAEDMALSAEAADRASANVAAVAAAAEQLSAAGREIAGQAAASNLSANRAVTEAGSAATTMEALRQAAERIGAIVRAIADVAERTNLLALNATIEAARAGEAGRGFAVVASEVKALARQTTRATEDIAARIHEIQGATTAAVAAIGRVGGAVHEIDSHSASVAAAVEEQEATIREIARSVEQAAADASSVAGTVRAGAARSATMRVLAAEAAAAMHETGERIGDLRGTMVVSLRSSAAGDRRGEARVPVRLTARLAAAGRDIAVEVLDISQGGALLRAGGAADQVSEHQPVSIDIPRIGRLDAIVLGRSRAGVHLAFPPAQTEVTARLAGLIAEVAAADARFTDAARDAAARIAAMFEQALAAGDITEAALFDTDYQPIAGSNPPQHTTGTSALADRLLPAIQEPLLSLDPRVVFAVAVDRNGYLPTHNTRFSQPQRPADPVWNAANSRQRRIFNDRAGLAAARSTRNFMVQSYERDMGNGLKMLMKEADAPIRIAGRHWGGFRLAYEAG